MLISNHLCEYERESGFVGEVLRAVGEQWLLMASEAFTSPVTFMSFVGLDKPPVEPSINDSYGRNRSQVVRIELHTVKIIVNDICNDNDI